MIYRERDAKEILMCVVKNINPPSSDAVINLAEAVKRIHGNATLAGADRNIKFVLLHVSVSLGAFVL